MECECDGGWEGPTCNTLVTPAQSDPLSSVEGVCVCVAQTCLTLPEPTPTSVAVEFIIMGAL